MTQENEQLQFERKAALESVRATLEKEQILLEAVSRRKTINILIDESGQFPQVKLLTSRNSQPQDLAKVVFTQEAQPASSSPQIAYLKATQGEWLLVYEPREQKQLDRLSQIGKYLPAFLDEIVEGAGKRPIWIFRSIEDYRLQLPFTRIRYFGNLITANIASTTQPNLS